MFLFPIEISNRELISKFYLACSFANKGYPSYIGGKKQVWEILKFTKNAIYFDKGYHKGVSEYIYDNIKNNNGYVVSLDEENGVDLKNNNTLDQRFPTDVFNYFDLTFLWGSFQLDYIFKNRKICHDNIFSFGHTRFELLKPKYQKLYNKDVALIKQKYNDYILINTSFGLGNNILGEDFVNKNYQSRIPNLDKIILYEKKQIKHLFKIITYLSENYNKNLIIRPHPEENIKIYKSQFKNIKNIHIIYDKSVIPWMLGAHTVIHHSCTTAIEAKMLGIQPISVGKDYNLDLIPWLPLEMGPKFEKKEDLLNYLLNENKRKSNKNNLLDEYFSFSKNSTSLIVNKTVQTLNPEKSTHLNLNMFYYYCRSNIKNQIKGIYNNVFGNKDILGVNKMKGLSWPRIKSMHQEMVELGMIDKNIMVNKINSDLFKVYRS